MSDYYMTGSHRRRDERDEVWHQSKNAHYFDGDGILTVAEAMQLGNMYDMIVGTAPLQAELIGGALVPVKNRFALTIDDTPWSDDTIVLRRIVGNRYEPMQNWRLAEILEGLNVHWPVEGTMVLKNGEIVIVQLKIDEFAVGNMPEEQHFSYLTAANDHIQGGIMWLRTDIRTVCWNTYSASLTSLDKIRLPHSQHSDATLSFLAKVEEETVKSQKATVEQLNTLFTTQINKDEFADIVDAAFPMPKKTTRMKIADIAAAGQVDGDVADTFFELVGKDKETVDWKAERQQTLRTAVGAAYNRFNEEHAYAAETAYGAFNAITEVVNHSDLFTGAKDKQMVSLIFGQKATIQQKAWEAAVDLI